MLRFLLENVRHLALNEVLNAALDAAARLMMAIPGHRLCCSPPAWTASVGQRWDTFDVAPWNLYNALWCAGQWAVRRAETSAAA